LLGGNIASAESRLIALIAINNLPDSHGRESDVGAGTNEVLG
jgi:hypothetical protein